MQTLGAGCCEFVGIGVIATAIDVDFGEGDPQSRKLTRQFPGLALIFVFDVFVLVLPGSMEPCALGDEKRLRFLRVR
jgi:hypothetical protein